MNALLAEARQQLAYAERRLADAKAAMLARAVDQDGAEGHTRRADRLRKDGPDAAQARELLPLRLAVQRAMGRVEGITSCLDADRS